MRKILLSAMLLIAASIMPGGVSAQPAISSEIAPLGKLRLATNAGNSIFIKRAPDGKVLGGVALEVGKFIADKLGVPFELVARADANVFVQSLGKNDWDIGFGPPTPLAMKQADFGPAVVLVDHVYIAAPGQAFADAAQVDRPGVKVGVGLNSSQDQFLSRTLKAAELVRAPSAQDAIDLLRSGKANLWASNMAQADVIIAGLPGAKIVPGAFNKERPAVALPKGRSAAAQARLAEIVNEAKTAGVVQKAIDQAGIRGVQVAPN